ADHDHLHVVVESRTKHTFVQLAHHVVRIRVGGWIVQLEYRDVPVLPVCDQSGGGTVSHGGGHGNLDEWRMGNGVTGLARRRMRNDRIRNGKSHVAAEEQAADVLTQELDADVAQGIVPVVDPVHHAKE